ncbi:dihydrolipoyl dehydrogenase family protein [Streptomyces sp. NPDC059271]|uniref:dihydrolipoyl dehydrogenase family protein n=1 Tax=Streptomyces sp. NPDC059271 TaxID=3346799 RepID=UPI00369FB0A5
MQRETEEVDLLVVGGGKGGKTLAMDRASAGQNVVMVERGMIGGSCINVACIPTKALVTSARALRALRRGREFGLITDTPAHPDLTLLREHKEGVVAGMVAFNHTSFLNSGMDFVIGDAVFTAERTVRVTLPDGATRQIRGTDTVINTGTRPRIPDIPGLADSDALTSESLLHLTRLPEHLIVLGAGPVGLEFADMFSAFGARVTVISRDPRLLPHDDPEITAEVQRLLTENGIDLRLGHTVQSVQRHGPDDVSVLLDDHTQIHGSDLLLALGREPVTQTLNLAAAGVATTPQGFVDVDDHLATSAPHTWAAGDVAGTPQFTHASLDDYRIIKANLQGQPRSTRQRTLPRTTFLSFDLAHIGLTEAQARQAGHDILIARLPAAAIPRARVTRETHGLWKAVIDASTDRILGATLLGPDAGEVLAAVQTAMLAGLPYTALRDMPITHPTMAEGLNLLFAKPTPS